MQMPVPSQNLTLADSDLHGVVGTPPPAVNARSLPPADQPNMALAGILLSIPIAVIATVALLLAGRPLFETLMVAFGVQIVAFCATLVLGLSRLPNPDPVRTIHTDTGSRSTSVDVWRAYSGGGNARNPFRVALISADMAQSHSIATNLVELGLDVHHSTNRESMLEAVQARPDQWGLVIFDLDSAPDLETGRQDLKEFRADCPEMPILFLSGTARRNDLLAHRRMTGDAVFRKPVGPQHLLKGLQATHPEFATGH